MSSSVQVYEQLFTDATPERINDLFDQLDESHTGYIDYLEWSKRVDLKDVPKMVKNCRTQGPLSQSTLTEEEFRQLRRMMRRLHDLASAASQVKTLARSANLDIAGRCRRWHNRRGTSANSQRQFSILLKKNLKTDPCANAHTILSMEIFSLLRIYDDRCSV